MGWLIRPIQIPKGHPGGVEQRRTFAEGVILTMTAFLFTTQKVINYSKCDVLNCIKYLSFVKFL
jgi:hypothetical protein